MWIPSWEESALLVVGSTVLKMNFLELSAAGPHPADLEVGLTVEGQPWKISEDSCLESSW